MASKRKTLCVDEKVLLIRAIEKGEKKSDVGRRFGFSPSTVSTIWKNKGKILQAKLDGKTSKKLKKPKFENLDKAMLPWIYEQHINNIPVSGPIIKAKAEKFAEQLGISDFKASEGWLGKFKKRHQINYGNNVAILTKLQKVNIEIKSEDLSQSEPGENSSSSEKETKQSPTENNSQYIFPNNTVSSAIPMTPRFTKVESLCKQPNLLDPLDPLPSSSQLPLPQTIFSQPKSLQIHCSTLASLWIEKLERLHPIQKIFAEKAINDILFEAELGNLKRNSVKINEPPPVAESGPCMWSYATPSSSHFEPT